MGTHQSRGTGSRELRWLTTLLYQAQVGHAGQHASRCKGLWCKGLFFKNDSDHRCMHVIEQVRGKVSGSQQVSSTRNHGSCLVHGLNDGDIAGMVGVTREAPLSATGLRSDFRTPFQGPPIDKFCCWML